MKKTTLIIVYISLIVSSSVATYWLTKPSLAYVDNQVVFNNYSLSSFYLKKINEYRISEERAIDSLANLVNESKDATIISEVIESLNRRERRKLEIIDSCKIEYDRIIWNSLNNHLIAFGEEKGFDFIFGANGTGTILFANDGKNVTEEFIKFINKEAE